MTMAHGRLRRRRMTDENCIYAVHAILRDREHHTFGEILNRAEFVPDETEDEDYPDDTGLGERQLRRGLAGLQDTLTDDIFCSFVCDDRRHDGGNSRPGCFGQWVYQLTKEVSKGLLYALRSLRTSALYNRKCGKALRQTMRHDPSPGRRRLERDLEKDVVAIADKFRPIIGSLAAEQGFTDPEIDRMIEKVMLDSV